MTPIMEVVNAKITWRGIGAKAVKMGTGGLEGVTDVKSATAALEHFPKIVKTKMESVLAGKGLKGNCAMNAQRDTGTYHPLDARNVIVTLA